MIEIGLVEDPDGLQKEKLQMKYITSINSKIKVCIQQGDRVICDDYVYLTTTVPLITPDGR